MPFCITITQVAYSQLRELSAREQRIVESAVVTRLRNQPTSVSKAIKKLRSNPLAEFELRVRDFRILYNVENDEVVILLVGRKQGNTLVVSGEEFHGHKGDPAE